MIASDFECEGVDVDVIADDTSGELTEVQFVNDTGKAVRVQILDDADPGWSWERTSSVTETVSLPAGHRESDARVSYRGPEH